MTRVTFRSRLHRIGAGLMAFGLVSPMMNRPEPLSAEEAGPTPLVVVPYDPSETPLPGEPFPEPSAYYLDQQVFEELWTRAKAFRERVQDEGKRAFSESKDYALTQALYRGVLGERLLRIEGRLSLMTRGAAWQRVPLAFPGASVSEVLLDGAPAAYEKGALLIEEPGAHEVVVRLEIRLERNQAEARWQVPAAAASLLSLEVEDEAVEPVVNGGLPRVESRDQGEGGGTLHTFALGQSTQLSLERRLRTTGRGMTEPNVAEIDAQLYVTPAVERIEARVRLGFAGQEERRFSLSFDAGVTPLRFEIPNLASWRLVDGEGDHAGLRRLDFELSQPARDGLTVFFVGERAAAAAGETRAFPRLEAAAIRLEYELTLLRANELDVRALPDEALRRTTFDPTGLDLAGFVPVATFARSGERLDADLQYRVDPRPPERGARATYVYQVGAGKLETIAQFELRSPEVPLTETRISLPPGATVQAVEGNRLREWWLGEDELFVRFSGVTPEVTAVLIYVAQTLEGEPETLTLPAMTLSDFEEVEGEALVAAHAATEATLSLDTTGRQAAEVDATAVARDFEVLPPLERKRGFRFQEAEYSAEVRLQPLAPRFEATWVLFGQVRERVLNVSIQVDLEVLRSALDRVVFELPAEWPEARLVSPEIREVRSEVDGEVRRYTVLFQRFVTAAVPFVIEAELPHSGEMALSGPSFEDASRAEGFVAVENLSSDRLQLDPVGLERTSTRLLPFTPEQVNPAQVFRAADSARLGLSLEKLETSAGRDAVVLWAELTTAFRNNGEIWLQAVYRLQNRSLQFLPVALPPSMELVSVKVAGEATRADRGEVDGRPVLLVPLIQTEPGQLSYDVELVLRDRGERSDATRPLRHLNRGLEDPDVLGVTVERTLWRVALPEGYVLRDAEGNMEPVESERVLAEKVQVELNELSDLNSLGAGQSDFGITVQRNAVSNSGVLAEQLEAKVRQLEQSASGESDELARQLRTRFEREQVILTENRIEMPVFEQKEREARAKQQALEQSGETKLKWRMQGENWVKRNKSLEEEEARQRQRLQNQVRLNDNVALGNDYFGRDADQNGVAGAQADAVPQTTEAQMQAWSQVGKLIEDRRDGEAGSRLRELSQLQVGGADTSGTANEFEKDKMALSPSKPVVGQNFIDIDRSAVQAKKKPASKAEAANKEVQDVGGAMQGLNRFNNARSSYDFKSAAQQEAPMPVSGPAPEVSAGSVFRSSTSRLFSQLDGGEPSSTSVSLRGAGLQAAGRRAVSVDFPIEGELFHFKKLKDRATLEIEAGMPVERSRILWAIALGIGLLVLAGIDRGLARLRRGH